MSATVYHKGLRSSRLEQANDLAGKLLGVLEIAARQRMPCPTNEDLRERFSVKSTATIIGAFARLEREGRIAVVRTNNAREVLLTELGLSTAPVTAKEVARRGMRFRPRSNLTEALRPVKSGVRSGPGRIGIPAERVAELPRVERDPCIKCGVRADIGCKHRRPE